MNYIIYKRERKIENIRPDSNALQFAKCLFENYGYICESTTEVEAIADRKEALAKLANYSGKLVFHDDGSATTTEYYLNEQYDEWDKWDDDECDFMDDEDDIRDFFFDDEDEEYYEYDDREETIAYSPNNFYQDIINAGSKHI